ncbi:MAG: lytic transglycosylase domain-containing protein [Nitrospinae bacterium]|nr:lytic transglycosylase domain-containing protein [Nitrospinota bacterium]
MAWAKEKDETGQPDLNTALPWIPEKNDRREYVARVRTLLAEKVKRRERNAPAPVELRPWFGQMIAATAWQESCFSQFRLAGERPAYLRSYNGSSVGLMQINERVWRGMYEIPSLRWDIAYNADAGIDILSLYLSRFALPSAAKKKLDLPPPHLAGALYAMYNGGPGQFSKYLSRKQKGKLYESDRLFAEKYERVVKGDWEMTKGCLATGK